MLSITKPGLCTQVVSQVRENGGIHAHLFLPLGNVRYIRVRRKTRKREGSKIKVQ